VGEIWSVDPSWLQGDQFDSLMNYALGREILLPFANGTMSAEEALYRLGNYFSAYGESVSGMGFNVVSTHDTGRLLSDLGGGKFGERPEGIGMLRLEMLETLLFSMPGTPVIFQGDERGITGEKRTLRFTQISDTMGCMQQGDIHILREAVPYEGLTASASEQLHFPSQERGERDLILQRGRQERACDSEQRL